MTNQPLTSSDHGKLLIFVILLIPAVVFAVGVIPLVFLAFGFVMLKKNSDFSSIETAGVLVKGYIVIALLISLGSAIYWIGEALADGDSWSSHYDREAAMLFFMGAIAAAIYLWAVHFLLLLPLRRHRDWVEQNGILSKTPRVEVSNSDPDVDIIKGQKLKSYSVADELLKWAELKEKGHISPEEFAEARRKLLTRN